MFSRLACAIAAWSLLTSPVLAQRISFIRDAEIEATIRAYATPVFTAAGLNANDIGVHIINDRTLNAFVANGLNLYINTGTLLQADTPLQVIGVMAHETGHIAGGHLARARDGMEGAMEQSIVAMVLGAAIMAAGGHSAAAGAGVMSAGTQVGLRSALQYSREMESQADQAGCNFLERAGLSARGLAEFLDKIEGEELLEPSQQDPYVRTHPITSERVEFVRNFVAHQAHGKAPIPEKFWDLHRRMQAKLLGYLDPARALQAYKPGTFKCTLPSAVQNLTDAAKNKVTACTAEDMESVARAAQYGRAIAYAQQTNFSQGLAEMDKLLQAQPNDPYFLEEKAQILFDSGKVADAVPVYAQSVSLKPDEPLIRIELAQAQLGTERADLLPQAIANLEQAKQRIPDNGDAWRLLAVAYGRDGQLGMAALSQAELESLRGQRAAARTFAERAQKQLKPGSAAWLRADDIKNANPSDKNK